jgi:hypothetical protein
MKIELLVTTSVVVAAVAGGGMAAVAFGSGSGSGSDGPAAMLAERDAQVEHLGAGSMVAADLMPARQPDVPQARL